MHAGEHRSLQQRPPQEIPLRSAVFAHMHACPSYERVERVCAERKSESISKLKRLLLILREKIYFGEISDLVVTDFRAVSRKNVFTNMHGVN